MYVNGQLEVLLLMMETLIGLIHSWMEHTLDQTMDFITYGLMVRLIKLLTFDEPTTGLHSDIQTYNGMYLSGSEPSLKGLWNFNEGQGTVLNDLSGNGNNGTIDGAVWDTDVPSLVQTTFQPQTKEELQAAVDLWVDDNATALDHLRRN